MKLYHSDMEKKIFTNSYLFRALDYSRKNNENLMRSVSCGCFSCETLMLANGIRDWKMEEDGRLTAVCPYCGEETVIGDDAVYPMKKEFLREMKRFWHDRNRR